MFRRTAARPANLAELERVEALVRARLGIDSADLVFVSEEQPRRPGYPARETVVLFWAAGTRHRLRVFRPVAEVGAEDLPPAWLRPALVDDGEGDCC